MVKIDPGLMGLEMESLVKVKAEGSKQGDSVGARLCSELQDAVQQLQDQVQKLRAYLGLELQPSVPGVMCGLQAPEHLDGELGLVGDFDKKKFGGL